MKEPVIPTPLKTKPFYITIGIVMFVLLISHNYNDILVTTMHGVRFWDILFEGNFLHFFEENIIVSGNEVYTRVQGCAYNILFYLVFAVWNIPLALITHFTDIVVMNNLFCIIWAKLLPISVFFVTYLVFDKLLVQLAVTAKMRQIAALLYFTSILSVTSIFLTGGYDILCVLLMLLGLLAYLKDDYKQFLLWFAVAVCFKYFALFIFVPLLLLKEKRELYILRDACLVTVIYLATTLPFIFHKPTNIEGGLFSTFFTDNTANNNFFVIAYAFMLIYAYLMQPTNQAQRNHHAIWLCFAGFACFFAFTCAYPYWSVLVAPFTVLLVAINPARYQINLLLEMVGSIGLFVAQLLYYGWCYLGTTTNTMLWGVLFPAVNACEAVALSELASLAPLCRGAFTAASIALLFLNCPHTQKLVPTASFTIEKEVLVLRQLAICGLCLVPLAIQLAASFFSILV